MIGRSRRTAEIIPLTSHTRKISRPARIALAAVAITLAIAFSSLGFWQLHRLAGRRAQNAFLLSRRSLPAVPLDSLPRDTAESRFRRVKIRGVYDYSREFALTLRTHNGSPGVDIITPIRMPGTDTVVLVNRGWIYAPDGMTANISRWREPDSVNATGFVETFATSSPFPAPSPGRARAYRWLDHATISRDLREPVAPFYVVIAPDSEPRYGAGIAPPTGARPVFNAPPRIEPRSLDEGPHRSYAIQWFSFAAISIVGMVIFLRRA